MKRLICAALTAAFCAGCMRAITIEKNDPIPVGTDGNAFIDGGYVFRYRNVGLKTDVSSISAEKTEKGVTIRVKGVVTDVSGENKEIVGAGGTAIGNVAEKVIEGVKGVETIKAK